MNKQRLTLLTKNLLKKSSKEIFKDFYRIDETDYFGMNNEYKLQIMAINLAIAIKKKVPENYFKDYNSKYSKNILNHSNTLEIKKFNDEDFFRIYLQGYELKIKVNSIENFKLDFDYIE